MRAYYKQMQAGAEVLLVTGRDDQAIQMIKDSLERIEVQAGDPALKNLNIALFNGAVRVDSDEIFI